MTEEELDRLLLEAPASFSGTGPTVRLAMAVPALVAEVRRLRVELDGETKANALLNAGMGSVCEGRDELKHRVRVAEAERDKLAARVAELEAGLAKVVSYTRRTLLAGPQEAYKVATALLTVPATHGGGTS